MADDVGPEAFVTHLIAVMGRADSRPTMTTITCPTLVLTGDQDNTIPDSKAASAEMADGIPGAKLVTIPECGHLPQVERPEATAKALVDWLRM